MEAQKSPGLLWVELGQALYRSGRGKEALKALQHALSEGGSDLSQSEVQLALARTYFAVNKDPEALTAYAEAIDLDYSLFLDAQDEITEILIKMASAPRPKESAAKKEEEAVKFLQEKLLGAANTLIQITELQTAALAERNLILELVVHILKTMIAWWPEVNQSEVLENLGWALLTQDNLLESEDFFKRAIHIDKKSFTAYTGLGMIYVTLEEFPKAITMLNRSLVANSEDRMALLYRGIANRAIGDWQASEEDLQHLTQLEPNDPRPYKELALTQQAQPSRSSEAAKTLAQAVRLLVDQGNYDDAKDLCNQAIQLGPECRSAYLQLGRALASKEEYDDALNALKRALEIERNSDVFIEMANLYYANEKYAEALQAADEALALTPGLVEAFRVKGGGLRQMERYEEALTALEVALTYDSKHAWTHAEKGAVLVAMQRFPEALAAFIQAVDLQEDYAWAYINIGMILSIQGDNEQAIAALDKAITYSPDTDTYTIKGQILYDIDRYSDAIDAFDKALELDSNNTTANKYRGACLRLLGKNEEAIIALQLSIDMDNAQGNEVDVWTYAEMGAALYGLDRYREASEAFKKAITKEDYEWAFVFYGETLRMMNQSKEALKYLERAVKLDPKDGWAWDVMGVTLVNLERHKSALQAFNKAIKLNPSSSQSWANKGVLLQTCQRNRESLHALDKALEITPDDPWLLVEKAITLRQMGDKKYKKALQLLEQVVRQEPQNALALSQLGACFYLFGEYHKAIWVAGKAFSLDKTLTWVNTYKGLALEKLGRTEEAEKTKALALENPLDPEAFLDRAYKYAEIGAFDHAIRDLKKVQDLKPNLPEGYNSLAWIYADYLHDHLEEAIELAKKAVQMAKDLGDKENEGKYLDTLGWAYYQSGRLEEALPILIEATGLLSEDIRIHDHLEVDRQKGKATIRS